MVDGYIDVGTEGLATIMRLLTKEEYFIRDIGDWLHPARVRITCDRETWRTVCELYPPFQGRHLYG